jgi:hypothetical protein
METQFLTDIKGKKTAVVLPIKKYEKLLEQLEDLHDIKLFDEAKKSKAKSIPLDEAFKIIESKRSIV